MTSVTLTTLPRRKLTPSEQVIYNRLLETPGEPVTRQELAKEIDTTSFDLKIIEVMICHIRHHLAGQPEAPYRIYSIWGIGYVALPQADPHPAPKARWTKGRKLDFLVALRKTSDPESPLHPNPYTELRALHPEVTDKVIGGWRAQLIANTL